MTQESTISSMIEMIVLWLVWTSLLMSEHLGMFERILLSWPSAGPQKLSDERVFRSQLSLDFIIFLSVLNLFAEVEF